MRLKEKEKILKDSSKESLDRQVSAGAKILFCRPLLFFLQDSLVVVVFAGDDNEASLFFLPLTSMLVGSFLFSRLFGIVPSSSSVQFLFSLQVECEAGWNNPKKCVWKREVHTHKRWEVLLHFYKIKFGTWESILEESDREKFKRKMMWRRSNENKRVK